MRQVLRQRGVVLQTKGNFPRCFARIPLLHKTGNADHRGAVRRALPCVCTLFLPPVSCAAPLLRKIGGIFYDQI